MNYRRGFIAPLLLILIAVFLMGGAYVFMEKSKGNESRTATSTAQTSNPQSTGWKTYGALPGGISISYPSTWFVLPEKRDSYSSVSFSNVSNPQDMLEVNTDQYSYFDVIVSDENPAGLGVTEWFEKFMLPLVVDRIVSTTTVTLGGEVAVQADISAVGGTTRHIYIARDNKLIEIVYGLYARGFLDDYAAMAEKIQFTTSTAQTANSQTAVWKTYINDKLKFRLQYPSDWVATSSTGVVVKTSTSAPVEEGLTGWYVTVNPSGPRGIESLAAYWIHVVQSPSLMYWFVSTYEGREKINADSIPTKTEMVVDGLPALEISDPAKEGACDSYIAVYFSDNVYEIQDPICDGSATVKAIYSSFKFIR